MKQAESFGIIKDKIKRGVVKMINREFNEKFVKEALTFDDVLLLLNKAFAPLLLYRHT